ncbi:CHAP domain-containing protein [Nocardioides sp. YIM 152588]|uniref:CHAP domain-containing protein n=1 Tax=Nocardioides sp. YIM 152588 TaxID=3158259 RepID=UPI0032E45EBA
MRRATTTVRWWSPPATSLLVAILLAGLLVAAGGPESTVRTVPVAGSTYLCSGYSGCRSAGYSDAGYGAVNNKMYWLMYSGHNCTNYAAYRMIQAGMSSSRPWSGSGMAYNWGHAMSKITDKTPAVGAIAWWDRYSNGIGSSGHVAYVEQVVSATEIVISEDSWNGTFHWRRITKDSGRWPSGFIHFKDAEQALTNTTAPAVAGTAQVGGTLTVSRGDWSPKPRRVTFQWLADGAPISGAVSPQFAPTAAEVGKALTVKVTARKPKRTPTTVATAATADVAAGVFANAGAPALSGTPMLDEELVVQQGAWSPAPGEISYKWKAGRKVIKGASGASLLLTGDLGGKKVKVVEIVSRPGYVDSRSVSVATDRVLQGRIEVETPFALLGRPDLGAELTVEPGVVTPADAAVTYTWLRNGVPIPDATGTTYVTTAADLGALVSVTATLSRRNYLSETTAAALPELVRSQPTMELAAVGRPHRAVVKVRVTAPGVVPVPGKVLVKVGGQEEWVTLSDGQGRVVIGDLRRGTRKVRAFYQGGTVLYGAKARTTVRVER